METANRFKLVTATVLLLWSMHAASSQEMAHAVLKDQQGKDVGHVELTGTKAGVRLQLVLKGLLPGERAFHIHEVGKCEPPFDSAGAHFNPEKRKHGKGPSGHAGDMPNFTMPKNGQLKHEVVNAAISLEKGKPNSVFQAGGTSIVIHQGKDDTRPIRTESRGTASRAG